MPSIEELLGPIGDQLNNLGSSIRYNVFPETKLKMMGSGDIPGMPPMYKPGDVELNGAMNPDAERYASGYLGAKKYGVIPATLFNTIALDDFGDGGPFTAKHLQTKGAGLQGALAGDGGGWQSQVVKQVSGAVQPALDAFLKNALMRQGQ